MTTLDYTPDPNPAATARRKVFVDTMMYLATVTPTLPAAPSQYDTVSVYLTPNSDERPVWQSTMLVLQELMKAGGRIVSLGYSLDSDKPFVRCIDVTLGHVQFTYESYTAARISLRTEFLLSDLMEAIDADETLAAELFDLMRNAAAEMGIKEFEAAVNRINLGV